MIIVKKLSLAISAITLSSQVLAAGFQVSEHSASGLGRAFSGEGATADNATILARNPAAMTKFDQMAFSSSISLVNPDINIKGANANLSGDDIAPEQIVPNAYLIIPYTENLAFGMAAFTTYGVATEYPSTFIAGDLAGETSLKTINLNPSIAYQVSPILSLGAGVNLVYGKADLTRYAGGPRLINMKGSTIGYGWNIGTLLEPKEGHRFALTYRSKVTMDFDGDFTDYKGSSTGIPNNEVTGNLSLPLASITEFSGSHQITDRFAAHYGVMLSGWSAFKELKATNSACTTPADPTDPTGQCFYKAEDYKDNLRYSIGGTYGINDQLTVRAGLALDKQAGEATLSIPDTDRTWYALGATWQPNKQWSFDFAYALVSGKTASFTEFSKVIYSGALQQGASQQAAASAATQTFEAESTANIFAAQVNYKF